jgi:hypothetical protein
MCRYAFHPYKQHYACFTCRRASKPVAVGHAMKRCPNCGGEIHGMGLDFKAPKQSDKAAWKAAEILHTGGIDYHSCGCSGPGYRPRKPREVDGFLNGQAQRQANEGQKLLAKIERQTRGTSKR